MKEKINITIGYRFNRLVILKEIERGNYNKRRYLCKCDCGNECIVKRDSLISGRTGSCRCFQREESAKNAKKNNTKHGLTAHPLFNVWRGIKKRCLLETHEAYHNYGGRGIKICDEWAEDFEKFYNWSISNGWKPGLQIDKDIIPKEMGIEPMLYGPEVCCFVTARKNCNNRRGNVFAEIDGVTRTAAEWALIINGNKDTISARIKKGLTGRKAVFGIRNENKKHVV